MYSSGNDSVVGEGPKAVGDDAMEIDSTGERRRTFYTGSEELLFRRDHMEVQHPMKGGLGASCSPSALSLSGCTALMTFKASGSSSALR